MSTLTLYRHALSGHAHRAELFLSILGLDAYPQLRAWQGRIAELPGFVPMQATAVGLAA